MWAQSLHIFWSAHILRQRALKQLGNASTHKILVNISGMRGKSACLKCMICGCGKVGYCVEQCAVKIKYN